jgi:S1-C subfamily serine protease
VRAVLLLLAAVLAACAQPPPQQQEAPVDSVVPGTIGVTVRRDQSAVVVSGVRKGSAARVGDIVLRYNGEPVNSPRQFYRLVVDSRPGSMARLEVMREGAVRTLELPVRELDVMPRA